MLESILVTIINTIPIAFAFYSVVVHIKKGNKEFDWKLYFIFSITLFVSFSFFNIGVNGKTYREIKELKAEAKNYQKLSKIKTILECK